jgi:hypothetical protein
VNPELEIIIPVDNPDERLARTALTLATQTDRQFSVLVSDNCSTVGLNYLNEAQRQLTAAGVVVRRAQTPAKLARLEHWNWAHAQARCGWMKPLPIGGELKTVYVEALKQRILQQPQARFVRCDVEVRTDWGAEVVRAPFPQGAVSPAGFLDYFPAPTRWLETISNMAFQRAIWQSTGGYALQFPACAFLNLNVILALHYGLENLHETLVTVDLAGELPLNERRHGRVNLWLELWLILRQARNYCLAANLPWSEKWLFLRGMTAIGR